jgi:hypothetical protein
MGGSSSCHEGTSGLWPVGEEREQRFCDIWNIIEKLCANAPCNQRVFLSWESEGHTNIFGRVSRVECVLNPREHIGCDVARHGPDDAHKLQRVNISVSGLDSGFDNTKKRLQVTRVRGWLRFDKHQYLKLGQDE